MRPLSDYLYEGVRHISYKETKEMYERFLIHSDEAYPKELIEERRPSESTTIQKYREKIYKCQTSGSFGKVLNSIGKIRKSQDWSILHAKKFPGVVNEKETLEAYMEKDFPFFQSFTNWFFSHGLKQYLVDPNAVECIHPLSFNLPENEYLKPFPTIYNSPNVYEFTNEQVLVKSEETVEFAWNKETHIGEVLYHYTLKEIFRIEQFKPAPEKDRYRIIKLFDNPLGYLPCRRLKAVFKELKNNQPIYKSRLSACLPHWDEAIREYSDLQADVVQHMHNTMWVWNNQKCASCKGAGFVDKGINKEGHHTVVPCDKCKGGTIPFNPYENIVQRPPIAGEAPAPSPPAGYIDKDTSIVEIQDERIDKHIYKGLAAINFEFLAVQLNQSGTAKELDRGELNAFIFDIAEDIINIFDWSYKVTSDWRYNLILTQDNIKEILPRVNVPEKYDIVSESYIVEEIKKAKDGGINQFIINSLELEYANKKFSTDRDLKEFVRNAIELDPLSGIPDDQKLVRAQSGYILKTDFIISNYISTFIRRALAENENFYSLELKQKQDILLKYAKDIESKTTVADKFKINDTRRDNKGDN
jgi:hypothetical protein